MVQTHKQGGATCDDGSSCTCHCQAGMCMSCSTPLLPFKPPKPLLDEFVQLKLSSVLMSLSVVLIKVFLCHALCRCLAAVHDT